jgi:anti-sigma factor RsiW
MSVERALHELSLRSIQENPERNSWPAEVREHVRDCERCQKTLEASLLLRVGLKKTSSDAAPEELRARVYRRLRQRLSPAPRSHARLSGVGIAIGLAVGIALGIAIGLSWRGRLPSPTPKVVDGLVLRNVDDYLFDVTHDRHLLDGTGKPIEHVADDPADLSRWLSQGLGFDVRLGTSPAGWRLRGGRVWHTLSRISAMAEYDRGDRHLDVFAVPSEGIDRSRNVARRVGEDVWVGEAWSYRAVAWHDRGLLWSVVGKLPEDEMLEWVAKFRGH